MDLSASREPDPPPISSRRDRAGGIVATATVLALLYFGRDVLVPVTLAVILSLLIAPLVRVLRSVGMGQTLSVLAAVLGLALAVGAIDTVPTADKAATSFGRAVQICLDVQQDHVKTGS